MVSQEKFRPGVLVTGEYPPTPSALSRKSLPKNNILVGDDPVQHRFLLQLLRAEEVSTVEKVQDDTLMGHGGLILHVHSPYSLDISPDVQARTGIWSADPIVKGSAALNAIVKHAAVIAEKKVPRETLEFVASVLVKNAGVQDIRGALWQAVWILHGDNFVKPKWIDPWTDPVRWLDRDTDPEYRLNSLYRQLIGWGFLVTNELKGLKSLGISPSQQNRLKGLTLDRNKVYDTIKVLSVWRQQHTDPYVAALYVAAIWSR